VRKVLVIASREYLASVRTKAFIISLVTMPILMAGSLTMQVLLKDIKDTEKKRFAIIDRTRQRQLYRPLEEALKAKPGLPFIITEDPPEADANRQRYKLSEKVRHGELFGFVEIGKDVLELPPKVESTSASSERLSRFETFKGPPAEDRNIIRYQTNSPTFEAFPLWIDQTVNELIQASRGKEAGVPSDMVKRITSHVPLHAKDLSQMDEHGVIKDAPEQNQGAAFGVPFGMLMLMFMVIMVGATPLMQGIVEEKMQRIAEVLLGSVRPFDLMLGKLLGLVGVSLTLVAVYMGGAFWGAHHFGFAHYLPAGLIIWFLVFQVLSVLMFGSLFIAIGAACTDMKETQTLLMPVMLLACIPMFFIANVIREPNSSFALGVSLFPFATPMLMVARLAVPPQNIPLWQPLLGVALVLITTLFCVYAAGRIFRVGILMQGKGAKFSDLVRWVIRG
jgi:ABC-2 type transport system permease protein